MKTGTCAETGPGNLKSKHVIHAVGPIWTEEPGEAGLLDDTISSALTKANELNCESVSIPAISSGTYGFPKPFCAEVFFLAIKQWVADTIEEV